MTALLKPSDAIRILVAHSHPLIRKGIEAALSAETDFAVVSAVGNGGLVVEGIRRYRPDISVVEFDLPDIGGLQIVATVTRSGLATKVLLLTDHWVGADVYRAMMAGVFGCLTSREPIKDICQAIRRAATGQRAFSIPALAALQEYLLQKACSDVQYPKTATGRPPLTERELQVLRCMADGISIKETGWSLHMSESTVKNHRHSIFAKLAVSNAPAAVSVGMRCGVLPASYLKKMA